MPATIGLTLLLQSASTALPLPRITPPSECPEERAEIVVCGRRDAADRYRVPPSERGQSAGADVAGAGLSASRILGGSGPCGFHAGQRRCSYSEARQEGYGGGRDPLTLARKLFTRLTDPDAEIDPPPSLPARR